MYYVVVDIGCIECGEITNVLGVFTDFEKAKEVMEDHEKRQEKTGNGQHIFKVFEIEKIDTEYRVNYE